MIATRVHPAVFDDGWYRSVVGFARDTPWLHPLALTFTNLGLLLFAVLAVVVWRRARHQSAAAMVSALWTPAAVLLAYGLSNLVKVAFREPRPCNTMTGVLTVAPCDFATDYSFPSNHTVIAAAAAVAILLAHRAMGGLAVSLAVLMGLSRVYIGAHYPHDVLAGFVLGAVIALVGLPVRAWFAAPVARWRSGRLAWLLGEPDRTPARTP